MADRPACSRPGRDRFGSGGRNAWEALPLNYYAGESSTQPTDASDRPNVTRPPRALAGAGPLSPGGGADGYDRRTVTGPLVVITRIGGPPRPRVVLMRRFRRPCTVTGKSMFIGPFTVPVSSSAE